MKKFIFVALFLLAVVFAVTPAFALDCKNGNYGSDACWTNAQLTTNDAVQALKAGTVMVYDFTTPTQQGNSADNAAFYVRAATTSDQANIVAGVLQQDASSSDRVMLLVRGQGKIRWTSVTGYTTYTSGDRLYVLGGAGGVVTAGERGLVTTKFPYGNSTITSGDKAIAFALTSGTTAATTDAYITIV